jgi:tRNA-dihydrouridine synthase
MEEQTGCDGFMIARGAQGNPWIFSQILSFFETGEQRERPTFTEVTDMLLRHARLQIDLKGENTGIREIRKHAAWYTAGYPNSAKLRGRINEVESYDDLVELFRKWQHNLD